MPEGTPKQPQYKPKMNKEFVHTLNATACAVPRLILSLVEQHQNSDGTVTVPEPLRPFLMGQKTLPFMNTRMRTF